MVNEPSPKQVRLETAAGPVLRFQATDDTTNPRGSDSLHLFHC